MDAAIMALEKAYRLDYDPSVRETAFYNYAVTRMEGGRTPFGSSVALMEDFLRTYPNSRFAPQVQEYLVTGYITDNNYDQALASINAISRPTPAIIAAKQRVLYILGSRDLANNRTTQALERFRESKHSLRKPTKTWEQRPSYGLATASIDSDATPTQPLHSPHICAPHQNPRPTAQSPSTTLHTPDLPNGATTKHSPTSRK